jgi:hypothetical protein
MLRTIGRWVTVIGFLTLCLPAFGAEPPAAGDERVMFKIDAPSMMQALIQFTQQSGVQLLLPTEGAERLVAPKVEGAYTVRGALDRLLQDSGLRYEFVNAHTIFVTSREPARRGASDVPTAGAGGR